MVHVNLTERGSLLLGFMAGRPRTAPELADLVHRSLALPTDVVNAIVELGDVVAGFRGSHPRIALRALDDDGVSGICYELALLEREGVVTHAGEGDSMLWWSTLGQSS